MTDKIDTTPEAVERIAGAIGRDLGGVEVDGQDVSDTIRALSARIAELEAELARAAGWLDLIANHQAANPHEDTECQAYARKALTEIKGETT